MNAVAPADNVVKVYNDTVEIQVTVTTDTSFEASHPFNRIALGMGREGIVTGIRSVPEADIVRCRVVINQEDLTNHLRPMYQLLPVRDVRPNSIAVTFPKVPVEQIAQKLHDLVSDLRRILSNLGNDGNVSGREVYLSQPLEEDGVAAYIHIVVTYTAVTRQSRFPEFHPPPMTIRSKLKRGCLRIC